MFTGLVADKGTVAAVKVDPIKHGTTKTRAFHLVTDAPVAAYSIFPYGGAESYYRSDTASGSSTFVGSGCAAVHSRLSPSDSDSSYSYYVGCE